MLPVSMGKRLLQLPVCVNASPIGIFGCCYLYCISMLYICYPIISQIVPLVLVSEVIQLLGIQQSVFSCL